MKKLFLSWHMAGVAALYLQTNAAAPTPARAPFLRRGKTPSNLGVGNC
jgi:hypothetical protein